MKRVLVSNPVGYLNSLEVAAALHANRCLTAFHTCLFRPFGLEYRGHPDLAGAPVVAHAWREMLRVAICRLPGGNRVGRSVPARDWVTTAFDRNVAAYVGQREEAVYAFEDFAQETFLQAKRKGRETIYDLPTVYFEEAQSIAQQELEKDRSLAPYWQASREPAHRIRRKIAEIKAADHVVCASSFVARTLRKCLGASAPRTSVVPLGADTRVTPKQWPETTAGPLRLLFVGQLAPHKGIHHLFSGLDAFDPNEFRLTMAGRWTPGFKEWLDKRYRVRYEHPGHLSRGGIYALCRENDALVFPALQDGFGLAITEAMAAGIPIAASRNSGAPDFMTDGVDGFLFEAGSSTAIHKVVGRLLDARQKLAEMGLRARQTAERLSWTHYRHSILETIGAAA